MIDKDNTNDDDSDKAPEYDFITGKLVQRPSAAIAGRIKSSASVVTSDAKDNTSTTELVTQNNETTLTLAYTSPAGMYLSQREFKGLEVRMGDTAVEVASEGRKGIAWDYHEGSVDTNSPEVTNIGRPSNADMPMDGKDVVNSVKDDINDDAESVATEVSRWSGAPSEDEIDIFT